jgi:hypothetical protein
MNPTSNPAPTGNSGNDTTQSTLLRGVGILELLECDPRPTFVLDAKLVKSSRDHATVPVYWNAAMTFINTGYQLQALTGQADMNETGAEECAAFARFQSWILNSLKAKGIPFSYCNFSWTEAFVANRWRVISGTPQDDNMLLRPPQPDGAMLSPRTSRNKTPTFDWTDDVPPKKLSSHVAWARSIDWSRTPLGPMSNWSPQIRSNASLVMQDPRPAVAFYGPELIMVYNEPYIELLGNFHPCIGVSARVVFAGLWAEYFEPIIVRNLAGETVEQVDSSVHMVRSGFMEETYFSLKFIPIFDSEGVTVGHYEPLVETVCSAARYLLDFFSDRIFTSSIVRRRTPNSILPNHTPGRAASSLTIVRQKKL